MGLCANDCWNFATKSKETGTEIAYFDRSSAINPFGRNSSEMDVKSDIL